MLGCGIIGLPLCGKTTVFNVVTRAGAEVKTYAGGKTDPNRAVIPVPDPRFDRLVEAYAPKKSTPAMIEFVDLAGLSREASKGAGLGNAFLSFAAEADALVNVVRAFDNPGVLHPEGDLDPARDWRIVETELVLRDLGVVEGRLERIRAKKGISPEFQAEVELLGRCQAALLEEKPLRRLGLTPDEKKRLRGYAFMTLKPQLVVLNLDETQADDAAVPGLPALAGRLGEAGLRMAKVHGRMEMDLLELDPAEQAEMMAALRVERPGRERLIREAFAALGLSCFFTVCPDEVRAWTIRTGAVAVDAAGEVHTDMARGFIRAQVVSYDDFAARGASMARCRESGVLRAEGRDYVVADGDIVEFRFNV